MSELLEQAGKSRDMMSDSQSTDLFDGLARKDWIRQLDPRVRIATLVIFALTVVQLHDFVVLGFALSLSIFLMFQARLPLVATLKRVAMMDSFILFMLVMLPFTLPGTPIFHLFGVPASEEGLLKAIDILLKANAIVMMTLSLIGTLEPVTLGHALARLKVPPALVHLLLFTVRYIEVLHQEYLRLKTAMKCRGFRPSNRWHTYRSVGYLVGMLLIRSFERSERIMQAMKCRGFSGQFHLLDSIAFSRRDALFAGISLCVMLSLLAMEAFHVFTA